MSFDHLNNDYKNARSAMEALPADAPKEQVVEARGRYVVAVGALAANDTGRVHLRRRASAIEAGDTPAGGDDLAVLRQYAPEPQPSATTMALKKAFGTGIPVPEDRVSRKPARYAESLAEALAEGMETRPEDRGPRLEVPDTAHADGGLAAQLRGDSPPDPYAGPLHFDQPWSGTPTGNVLAGDRYADESAEDPYDGPLRFDVRAAALPEGGDAPAEPGDPRRSRWWRRR